MRAQSVRIYKLSLFNRDLVICENQNVIVEGLLLSLPGPTRKYNTGFSSVEVEQR